MAFRSLPSEGSVSSFPPPRGNAFPPGLRTRALRLIRSSIRVRLLSPPPASAGALTTARTRSVRADWTGKWSHRRDVRPGLLDTNETRRYLRFGGLVPRVGIAPTLSMRTMRLQRIPCL